MAIKHEYPYEVYNQHGERVCSDLKGTRYSPITELELLKNGYTIYLNGKKLTQKEIKGRKK